MYQASVPFVSVPGELFRQWATDLYHPDAEAFRCAFSPAERTALAEFQRVLGQARAGLPDQLPELGRFQATPQAAELAWAAGEALTRLSSDVDEVERLASDHPYRMYRMFRHRASTRQIRLFMAACCRLHPDAYFDPRIAHALAAIERCADDPRAEAEAEAAWSELMILSQSLRDPARLTGEIAQAIQAVWQLLDEHWVGEEYHNVQHALSHAVYLSLREHPGDVFTGGEGDAAEYCAKAVEAAERLKRSGAEAGGEEIRHRIVYLLEDIFGDPFRQVAFETEWRTATVLALARGIYADGTFDQLPILADALEDAGCADEELLGHCRGPGPHVRGCWAIDLLRSVD